MINDWIRLKEIKPALYSYIREAVGLLDREVVPDDNKVHDLRVLMKKSRAVMKLISQQTDSDFYEREYSTFRETGRIARSWRESAVQRKTLKVLKKRYPDVFSTLAGNEKLNRLIRRPDLESAPSPGMKEDIEKIAGMLEKSGYRLRFIQMGNLDPVKLLAKLEATYSEVSRSYLLARNYPKPVNLHEFRKKAKDFLYQLWFFRTFKPETVKSLEKRVDSIAGYLGKYNDLAVILKSLGYSYGREGNDDSLDELAVVIKQEQDKYLGKVWPSAYRIFCHEKNLVNILNY